VLIWASCSEWMKYKASSATMLRDICDDDGGSERIEWDKLETGCKLKTMDTT
jgi:hypothetical protein